MALNVLEQQRIPLAPLGAQHSPTSTERPTPKTHHPIELCQKPSYQSSPSPSHHISSHQPPRKHHVSSPHLLSTTHPIGIPESHSIQHSHTTIAFRRTQACVATSTPHFNPSPHSPTSQFAPLVAGPWEPRYLSLTYLHLPSTITSSYSPIHPIPRYEEPRTSIPTSVPHLTPNLPAHQPLGPSITPLFHLHCTAPP